MSKFVGGRPYAALNRKKFGKTSGPCQPVSRCEKYHMGDVSLTMLTGISASMYNNGDSGDFGWTQQVIYLA